MKDIEKMSSDELKQALGERSADLPSGGSQESFDNVAYTYVEPEQVEEEPEGVEEEQVGTEPEKSDQDVVTEHLEQLNAEKMGRMDVQSRSFYQKALREVKQQEWGAIFNDLQAAASELTSRYRDFPEELERFGDDFVHGRIRFTKEELESENPGDALLFRWLPAQKGISHERIKRIVETYHTTPRLKTETKTWDRIRGYDLQPQRRMTDQEIEERISIEGEET